MIITGTITKNGATAHYLVDTEAGTLTQIGGDATITAEDIDLLCGMMTTPHEDDEPDTPEQDQNRD